MTQNERKSLLQDIAITIAFAAAGIIIFTLFNYDRELVRLECRFQLLVREAIEAGKIGVFPTLYGEPYTDYPSTYTMIASYLAKTFSSLNSFFLVLPSAAAMSLTLSVVYLTGRIAKSRTFGITAALLLMMTVGVYSGGRAIALDTFVCLGGAGAFLCALAESKLRTKSILYTILMWFAALAFMSFAFAFRGPIGFIVSAAAFIAFYLGAYDWKRTIAASFTAGIGFLAACGAFAMLIYQNGGSELLRAASDSLIHTRMDTAGKGFHYYYTNGLGEYAIVFPLAIFTLVACWGKLFGKAEKNADTVFLRQCLFYGFIILVGLTIPGTRHLRYILPMAPAFALASAFIFVSPELFDLPEKVRTAIKSIKIWHLAVAAFIFAILCIFVLELTDIMDKSSRKFTLAVEQMENNPAKITFYKVRPDTEELPYLCNSQNYAKPVFADTPEEIAPKTDSVIVTRDKNYESLPPELKSRTELKVKGRLGGKKFVAFVITK